MSWTVREEDRSEHDLAAVVRVVNAVTPENPTSLDELRWQDATYPGTRFLAESGGEVVATATTGRIYMYGPDYERYWIGLCVLEPYRRQGIGSALYRAVSGHARAAGKIGLQTLLEETHVDGIEFLTHRGFVEIDRAKIVRLELVGLARPEVGQIAGIEFTTLAARPDLVPGIHRVAERAFRDIPAADEPIVAGTLEEFRTRDVERPGIPADAFQVALDASDGRVVGYASLQQVPSQADRAWHDMTAVDPDYRGRGIATALKRATIGWAIDAGLVALDTGNDELNAPMRAVNARLGYRPTPDEISFRGPLAEASAG
jgi:GNAT superfamily N-acetyltransferase